MICLEPPEAKALLHEATGKARANARELDLTETLMAERRTRPFVMERRDIG